ncbi:MAG: DHH family phosphoesterase, partial [Verrucomicrobiae bacterium]|nr:DHH family phosphoesterase [Verrucomicrobiae bacterium]
MPYYPETSPDFKNLVDSVNGKRIAVVGHVRPDGDCIGSQVALCRVLNSAGIESVCVNHDPVPRTLQFLVGDTPFHRGKDFDLEGWDILSVDCADARRTGDTVSPHMDRTLGNIDHHISNTCYGKVNLIEGSSSATGEILAGYFLDGGFEIDPITANALYVGIATDTGQFRFPATTRHTFEIAGKLIEQGVDLSQVNLELYERESFPRLELLQRFSQS